MKLDSLKDKIVGTFTKSPSEKHGVVLEKKSLAHENRKYIVTLCILTPLLFIIYFVSLAFEWFFVEIGFMAMLAVSAITYVVYNKGFSLQNITKEMLPSTMSEERKEELIEKRDRHIQKSKWMLTIIVPLALILLTELFILYLLPLFQSLFGGA